MRARGLDREAIRDIGLLQWDVLRAQFVIDRDPDPLTAEKDAAPAGLLGRVEGELAGEARRYRRVLIAAAAMLLMPGVLAAFAWSAMYWLPVRIMWFPFERGAMGLPWLSLYEWVAFLTLAAFLAFGTREVARSRSATARLSADYRRLVGADAEGVRDYARTADDGAYPRARAVLAQSPAFAMYRVAFQDDDSARSGETGEAGEPSGGPVEGAAPGPADGDSSRGAGDAGAPLTAVDWSIGQGLGLVLVVLALTAGAGTVIALVRAAEPSVIVETLAVGGALLGVYALQLLTVWGMARAAGSSVLPAVGARGFAAVRWLPTAFAVAVVMRILAGLWATLLQAAGAKAPGPGLDVTQLLPRGPLSVVFVALLVVVAAPLAEEAIFRGVVFSAFARRFGSGWGAFVSSAVFGLLHANLYAAVPIFVLALALCELYRRSRSLWVPFAAHCAFNALGIVGIYLLKGAGLT